MAVYGQSHGLWLVCLWYKMHSTHGRSSLLTLKMFIVAAKASQTSRQTHQSLAVLQIAPLHVRPSPYEITSVLILRTGWGSLYINVSKQMADQEFHLFQKKMFLFSLHRNCRLWGRILTPGPIPICIISFGCAFFFSPYPDWQWGQRS